MPVILIIAVLVRCESPGNPFFTQTRVGRNGKPFVILKIRTLYLQYFGIFPREDEPEDYRITKIGRFLRRSKLDELPQLLNIILGDMSVVGPRPDIPVQVATYTIFERKRLLVKPGLTGLTQISGNTALNWSNRIKLDIFYIEHWSFLFDIKILCSTIGAVIKGETILSDPFKLNRE